MKINNKSQSSNVGLMFHLLSKTNVGTPLTRTSASHLYVPMTLALCSRQPRLPRFRPLWPTRDIRAVDDGADLNATSLCSGWPWQPRFRPPWAHGIYVRQSRESEWENITAHDFREHSDIFLNCHGNHGADEKNHN